MAPRRRTVLAGVAIGLAGCTDPRETVEDLAAGGPHPLAGRTAVRVRDESHSALDLQRVTDEALAFWNEHATAYAGFDVEFHRVQADADVAVVYRNDRDEFEGCTDYRSHEILGCAPLIRQGDVFRRPVTAEVVATDRPVGDVRVTVMHELGHLLGLGHDAEPAYVMSNRIEDRLPEYGSRIAILEAVEAAWTARNEGTRTYNEGVAHWNAAEYEAAVAAFDDAHARYRAILDHVATAESAATAFRDMPRPDTVDRQRLEAALETTRTVAEHLIAAAEHMRAAARAMLEDDRRRAREQREVANDALAAVGGIDAPTPADVARALGLVPDRMDPTPAGTPRGD